MAGRSTAGAFAEVDGGRSLPRSEPPDVLEEVEEHLDPRRLLPGLGAWTREDREPLSVGGEVHVREAGVPHARTRRPDTRLARDEGLPAAAEYVATIIWVPDVKKSSGPRRDHMGCPPPPMDTCRFPSGRDAAADAERT